MKFLILSLLYNEKLIRGKWRLRIKTIGLLHRVNLKLENFIEFLILFNKAENELIKEKLICRERELIPPKGTYRYRYTLTKKGEEAFKKYNIVGFIK